MCFSRVAEHGWILPLPDVGWECSCVSGPSEYLHGHGPATLSLLYQLLSQHLLDRATVRWPLLCGDVSAGSAGRLQVCVLSVLLLNSTVIFWNHLSVFWILSSRYLLNCWTFRNQTWSGGASSWARVLREKIFVLFFKAKVTARAHIIEISLFLLFWHLSLVLDMIWSEFCHNHCFNQQTLCHKLT